MKTRTSWRATVIAALVALLITVVATGCGKTGGPKTTPNELQTTPTSVPSEKVTVNVYFLRGEERVPVKRQVDMAGPREALLELLKGPSQAEGLSTAIPEGTTLRKCDVLEDGTAKVDFSREILNFGGGSARITAIIDQITKTVQANDPAVRTVAITVEGQPAEEVLQP